MTSQTPSLCTQIAWTCEAFMIGTDGSPVAVQGTVLEVLESHNVL